MVFVVIAAACGSNGAARPPPRSATPRRTRIPLSASSPASCAEVVFDRLTPPQRVGQLFTLGLADDRLGSGEVDAIRSHHVGSVWFTRTTTGGAGAVRSVVDQVQAEGTPAATGGVRFYVAANQEGSPSPTMPRL